MEDYAPFVFLRSWALVVPYLCSRFCIFDRLVLEEYNYQVEGAPHLLQSCFRVAWDNLFVASRKMHLFFQSLAITDILGLQAFFMDIHHDISFRFILEDDSISLTFRTCIHFCSNKRVGLWLIIRPSICSFHIAHFIFISTLHFRFSLIQPLTSSFFTCECG